MKTSDTNRQTRKIVIVGGVAGGMSAAARARRLSEDSEIIVLERSAHVSYANCGLPYFLGGEIQSEEQLIVATPEALRRKLNLDIRVNNEVIKIDSGAKVVTIREIKSGKVYQESFDDLILSVGAAAIKPDIPGIGLPGLFSLRNIEDIEAIQSWFESQEPRTAVIAGGGFIGLEMAEQFTRRGLAVTLVDGKDQVLSPIDPEMASIVHQELRRNGVRMVLGNPVKGFRAPAELAAAAAAGVPLPKSCWVQVGDSEPIPADIVILGLGVRPEIGLARNANLAIGERGGIKVDEYLRTSSENIWAVGDAIEVLNPINKNSTLIALGGPANRQGRIAADNIFGANKVYDGTLGTAILRVFDLTVGSVGLNEQQLHLNKIPFEAVYVHPSDHASYYPGAERLDMKVLFHKESGGLLGAQVIGKKGADKRVDVIATAIKAGMTIRQLAELELAYAPPFGSAKDAINLAGMAGTNVLDGLLEQVHWHQIADLDPDNYTLLDVRSDSERARGFIDGSLHIPLPELRNRLSELPQNREIICYCQSGQRSYNALRFLKQNGFNVKNLAGGYLTWSSMPPAKGRSEKEKQGVAALAS